MGRCRRRRLGNRPRRSRKRCPQGEGACSLRGLRTAKGLGPVSLQRRRKEVQMKRQRTNRLGSITATALNALALVSVARMVGPKRIARVAALATEGYLTRQRRGRSRR